MQVYGDRSRTIAPCTALAEIARRLEDSSEEALTSALIEAGGLAQGLADLEFHAAGHDDVSDLQSAAMALATAIAGRLLGTGDGADVSALRALQGRRLPGTVQVRDAEGYAFYAVYPQAYAAAAASHAWEGRPLVIGLRSIGTSLAAIVAAATGGEAVSMRPAGPPFRREARASERLKARLAAHDGPFAIVDEGPGLSGSSFGCVADLLASLGIAEERIVFMPSHAGDLGPNASPRHRERWSRARRLVRTLDDIAARDPVPGWFAAEVGSAERIQDISGGAWRTGWRLEDWPPAVEVLERRKIRFRTASGDYSARFAGLGHYGEAKFARAQALHTAGFAPKPIALRRGFLLERWVPGDRPHTSAADDGFLRHLGAYLAFRRDRFPASAEDGANPVALMEMARANAEALWGRAVADRVDGLLARFRPAGEHKVHVDGRLHPWEWRLEGGAIVKLDAIDHSCGHDLVGAQDILWDVAGARIEFDLEPSQLATLARTVSVSPQDVLPVAACYAAFQAGLLSLPASREEAPRLSRRRAMYRDRLMRVLREASAD